MEEEATNKRNKVERLTNDVLVLILHRLTAGTLYNCKFVRRS
jgi:hypothetical protein